MTADRLAALTTTLAGIGLDFWITEPTEDGGHMWFDYDAYAAALAAQGVTVGLDVERLAAALEGSRYYLLDTENGKSDATAVARDIARVYAATPQPAEEEGR